MPRLIVFNKVDRVNVAEAESLRRHYPDALFISATRRETTRALLAKMADLLADKWEQSATTASTWPDAAPADEAAAQDARETVEEQSLTTLEQMLGRPRRNRPRTQAGA